ncbi:MAG: polyprenyl synthetase family protein [Bifidobacteriaceae bacterium]|jgi:geranylgeranyl diphosphate synthase type I|nr:polyprenyl synthetase family protein [Bifidobacteriaceae bacterium]
MSKPLGIDDFAAAADQARISHLAGTATVLGRFTFPAELGVGAVAQAREGTHAIHTRLLGQCYIAHGADTGPEALPVDRMALTATALEMFQDGVLVHDDLMDRSDTRRGRASLHRYFANMHEAREWLGDGSTMALAVALLVGDSMVMMAGNVIRKALLGVNAERAEYMTDLYYLTLIEQLAGQAMDTVYPYLPELDDPERIIESAMETIQAKTARYMTGTPFALGAAGAGADQAECNIMMEYGLKLGTAFQLKDDLLGVTGDTAVTGKPVGQDLVDAKRTVLVGLTLRRLDPAERRAFAKALLRGNTPPVQARVAHLQGIIRDSGAQEELEGLIESTLWEARQALERSSLDEAGKVMMRDCARWLMNQTVT